MKTLSKAAETTLLTAIEKAATYVNGGMAPNDAIIKSAGDHNIPAGHIDLMVHAYNTGRTTKQRETGENTIEKAADFPIAEADVIKEALFPSQVKTSQELLTEDAVSIDYAVSPKGMLARRLAQQNKQAAATHSWGEPTWTPPPKADTGTTERKRYSEKIAATREYEEARRLASALYQKAAVAMEKLATYFREPGHMAFYDVMAETEMRVGADGVNVLKKIAAVYPYLEKQASTSLAHFGDCEPVNMVVDIIEAVTQYADAQKYAASKQPVEICKKIEPVFITDSIMNKVDPLRLKQAAINGVDTIYLPDGREQRVREDAAALGGDGIPAGYSPFGAAKPLPPSPDEALKKKLTESEKALQEARKTPAVAPPNLASGAVQKLLSPFSAGHGAINRLGTSLAASMTTPEDPEKAKARVGGAYKQLTDPDHELQLRNIRAKSTLNDLVMNDPVISGYDPAEISLAFNEISEIAPDISDSPVVMQALLRKRLEQGQLSDFEIKQLMDVASSRGQMRKTHLETKQLERDLVS
jgi:hypothetical protein